MLSGSFEEFLSSARRISSCRGFRRFAARTVIDALRLNPILAALKLPSREPLERAAFGALESYPDLNHVFKTCHAYNMNSPDTNIKVV